MKTFIFIISICLCSSLSAQFDNDDYAWKLLNKARKSQNIFKVTEINDGQIIGVGYTNRQSAGGKDIYIVKIDRTGKIVNTTSIGGKYDDVARSVVFTPSGKILICGSTGSKNINQGIVIQLNPDFSTQMFYLDENNTQSVFNDIIIDREDNIFVCGTSSGKMVALKLNEDGDLKYKYQLDQGKSTGQAIISTKDGNIVVTGSIEKKKAFNNSVVLIAKLSPTLKELAIWNYAQDDCYVGNDIVELNNGSFAIAASGLRNRINAPALANISGGGIQLYGQTFATFIEGGGTGITLTPSGDLILTGIGSDVRGAKRTSSFAVRVNPQNQGSLVWRRPLFFGGDFTDECNTAYCTSNGNVIIAGFSNNGAQSDFYLNALKPTERDIEAMTILKKIRIIETKQNNLFKNDAGQFEITLKNEATQIINNFKIKVELLNNKSDYLTIPDFVLVEAMKEGEIKKIKIPVQIKEGFADKNLKLKYSIVNTGSTAYETKSVEAAILGSKSPNLVATSKLQNIDLRKRNKIVIPFEITNTGNVSSLIKSFNITFNENVFLAPDFEMPVNVTVKTGESYKLNVECYADSLFNGDVIGVNIKIGEISGLREVSQEVNYINQRKVFDVVNKVEVTKQELVVLKEDDISLNFNNITKTVTLFDRNSYKLNIDASITKAVLTKNYAFLINDKMIDTDSIRMDESNNKFVINIPLKYGKNQFAVQNNSSKSKSNLSEIKVIKSQVNYYIYIIGTDPMDPDGDPSLKYSVKDVNDFYAQMQKFGKEQNAKIDITLYNTRVNTTSTSINKLFETIYKKKNKYKPNDVLIIYWVAQGFATNDGNIMIKGSDILGEKKKIFTPELYSAHLTKYFIPFYLDPLPCKKIMLLDIYNREEDASDEKDKEALEFDLVDKTVKAIKSYNNFDYILSGDLGQKSYELDSYKNGAFTYSVLKALEQNQADLNKDEVIELSEFFTTISKSIPDLVVKNRKEKYWNQKPLHLKSKNEDDVVIYYK